MGKRGWVIVTVLLGAAVINLWWQNGVLRHRRARAVRALEEREADDARRHDAPRGAGDGPAGSRDVQAALSSALPGEAELPVDGEPPPPQRHWLIEFFTPHPGEDLLAYRDRVLPVVQAVAEPQRKRVTKWRDEFAAEANLSDAQKQELDTIVGDAGDQIKDRIMEGVLSGELNPRTIKASTGVAFTRDVLNLADGANQKFRGSLSDSQRGTLDGSRFDVVDYLFFHTRWEDLLGATTP